MSSQPDFKAKASTVMIFCFGLTLIAMMIDLGIMSFFQRKWSLWLLPVTVQFVFSVECWYKNRKKPELVREYGNCCLFSLAIWIATLGIGFLVPYIEAYVASTIGAMIINWSWFSLALKYDENG